VRVKRLPRVAGAKTPKLAELAGLAISNATRKIAAQVQNFLSHRPPSRKR